MQAIFKKNKKLIISIAVLLNAVALTSIFTRATDIDEGIIAAHSYYLNESGYVRSVHFHNADFGWEERQYHYHKLAVWSGAVFSKVFGFHLLTFRFISFLSYLFFLLILYKYFRLKEIPDIYFWLFQIIFLINSTAFKFAFIYRPEIVVMTLGFLSYYLLEKNQKEPSVWSVVGAGIAAGAAMLIHLNGVIFIVAGTFMLFLNRKFIKGFAFGATGTIVSAFYFADLLSAEKFANWKLQFFADPNLTGKKAFPLLKVLEEHMRFFHSEREAIFSALVLISLILAFVTIKKLFAGKLSYFFILVLSLAFIAHGTTTKYMLIYMPFLVIIVCVAFYHFSEFKRVGQILLSLVFLMFIGYNGYVNTKILAQSYPVVKRNAKLAKHIPEKNTLIFANEGFVFNQIGNFAIQSPCAFNFHYSKFHPGVNTDVTGLFEFLNSGKTQFVLIDQKIETSKVYRQIPYNDLEIGSLYFNYKVIDKGEDFILFEIDQ